MIIIVVTIIRRRRRKRRGAVWQSVEGPSLALPPEWAVHCCCHPELFNHLPKPTFCMTGSDKSLWNRSHQMQRGLKQRSDTHIFPQTFPEPVSALGPGMRVWGLLREWPQTSLWHEGLLYTLQEKADVSDVAAPALCLIAKANTSGKPICDFQKLPNSNHFFF